MKILKSKLFYFFFTLVFVTSCQTEPRKKSKSDEGTTAPKELTTAEKRDLASKDWRAFWAIFQKAVAEGDVETLVNHIEFPLKGSGPFNEGKQISKASFSQHFSKIFDEQARKMIVETDNMSKFITKKQEVADQLNVPANKTIRSLMVLYVTDAGKENQTESSVRATFFLVAYEKRESILQNLCARSAVAVKFHSSEARSPILKSN